MSDAYNGRVQHASISDADAFLIAAAPDLLAALRDIVAGFRGSEYEDSLDDARAAIAKAEGRS